MKCNHCKSVITGKGDAYYCSYCDLPLCRLIDCIESHENNCEQERERMIGDTTQIKSATHRTYEDYSNAKRRALERETL